MTDPVAVVREWFGAFNRGEVAALVERYAEDAIWDGDDGLAAGRVAIGERLLGHFGAWDAALDRGARRRLRTLGRIESGVAAEWVSRERSRTGGALVESTGYSHFIVGADGRIRRQRDSVHAAGAGVIEADAHVSSRRYPPRPVVGIGAAIVESGRVVLIKRRYEPLAGQWSLPGGTLELGETLEAAVAREMLEETGLHVAVGPVVDVFDRILFDPDERVRYHFVLIDYLCRPVGGTLCAGSDVADAVFASAEELPGYRLTSKAADVAERALAMASRASGSR